MSTSDTPLLTPVTVLPAYPEEGVPSVTVERLGVVYWANCDGDYGRVYGQGLSLSDAVQALFDNVCEVEDGY